MNLWIEMSTMSWWIELNWWAQNELTCNGLNLSWYLSWSMSKISWTELMNSKCVHEWKWVENELMSWSKLRMSWPELMNPKEVDGFKMSCWVTVCWRWVELSWWILNELMSRSELKMSWTELMNWRELMCWRWGELSSWIEKNWWVVDELSWWIQN